MSFNPPPYPPPQPPYPVNAREMKYQRRLMRDQAKAQRDQLREQMRGLRRRSIAGPLLAVLLGIVFLLVETGKVHSDRFWIFYGRWWPLLLIVVGGVMLAEWVYDQARPNAVPPTYGRRTVGGGVVALVIVLSIAGAIAGGPREHADFFLHGLSINPDNVEQFLGEKHESEEALTEPLPVGMAVAIESPHGDVTISGTSNDGEAHLVLQKQVYTRTDTEAQAKMRDLMLQVQRSGGVLSLKLPEVSGGAANLTLTLPALTAVSVIANHGDVHIDGTRAPLNITANHGDVTLASIGGAVSAHINHSDSSFSAHGINGAVTVEGHGDDLTLSDVQGAVSLVGDFYGTTHLEHLNGNVRFHTSRTDLQLVRLIGEMEISPDAELSADQVMGPVVLTTRNRNINMERISGDLSVTNRNGSVELTSAPPLGNVTVENRNGSVTLTLPEHANFAVSAETTDGDLENDFALPNQESNGRKMLAGAVGHGGSAVHITTTQGDVALKQASVAPNPPIPPAPPIPPPRPPAPKLGSSSTF